jgi:uncharacterized protein (TIRG00374 family)
MSAPGAAGAAAVPPAPDAFPAGRPKSWRAFALKLAASLALIAYILSRAELSAVAAALGSVELGWLAVAVALQFLGPAIISLRWRGLLAAKGVTPGWPYLYASTLVSGFFRQFMPTIVGGDVIRGYDAWRAGAAPGLALMSLVLDRLLGLLALALLAAVGIAFSDEIAARLPAIGVWVALAAVAVTAAIVQIVRPLPLSVRLWRAAAGRAPAAIRGKLGRIAAALGSYRDAQGALARGFALSVVLQVNVVTFYWALAQALGLPVDYASFFVIVPIAIFVMMLPISINGIGVREGIFIFLLAQWGVDSAHAIALAWLEYGIFLAFGLLGGLLYALRRR